MSRMESDLSHHPHADLSLGVERTLAWITTERQNRQSIAFPGMTDKVYV